MIKLKNYQEKSLETLRSFLEFCRFEGVNSAYDKIQYQRYGDTNFKPFQPLSGRRCALCLFASTYGRRKDLAFCSYYCYCRQVFY